MTDEERMQHILDTYKHSAYPPSFTEIVLKYLYTYTPDLYEHNNFYNEIHRHYMLRISELEKSIGIAREYATYVSMYLKGEIYKDKETAIEALPLQIKHAERVVKELNEYKNNKK